TYLPTCRQMPGAVTRPHHGVPMNVYVVRIGE
ncbi:unnamed protein product, partial [marine sediment metagenome]